MTLPVVVIGAGGFGREALDVIEAAGHAYDGTPLKVVGVVDDSPSDLNLQRLHDRGIEYLGTTRENAERLSEWAVFVAIGNPAVRSAVVDRLGNTHAGFPSVVHPSAVIGSRCVMNEGVVICGGVQVSTNVRLGRHVHLNPNATVGHDATIEEFVSVNPGAIVSGDTTVGPRTLVGAGSVVLQGLTVDCDAVVGASACVVRDVEPGSTVKGVPAR